MKAYQYLFKLIEHEFTQVYPVGQAAVKLILYSQSNHFENKNVPRWNTLKVVWHWSFSKHLKSGDSKAKI